MELTSLPFDQYARYRIIADALAAVRPLIGGRLRLLDVGGYFRTRRELEMLPARAFLPEDDVTVLDQPACSLPGYIQGDGRGLSFANASFDFVISCDTLEHVPVADRAAFWGELLRVARYGVLLIAPAQSPHAEAAERLVMAYIQAELGQLQPQLAEHRAYGLPNSQVIADLLNGMGFRHTNIPSGHVHAWVLMMIARHTRPICDDPEFGEQLDAYYSQFLSIGDRREPAYRRLWIVEKQPAHGWFEAASVALSRTVREHAHAEVAIAPHLVSWQLQISAMREAAGRAAAQQARIAALEQELIWRTNQVTTLEQRATWLEQQAREAQTQIQKIANGRVMRLLRKIRP